MKLSLPASNQKLATALLRVGLAITFLYAGVGSILHPDAWAIFLPSVLTTRFSVHVLLGMLAAYQFILVVWLVSGWKVRYAGALCAITLLGIVVTNGNALDITFRDIALTFMALVLYFQG